jgi:hypothetical protein
MGEQRRLHLLLLLSGRELHYSLLVCCYILMVAKSLLKALMHHDGFLLLRLIRTLKIHLHFQLPFLLFSNSLMPRVPDFLLLNFEEKDLRRLCQLYYIQLMKMMRHW